MNSFKLPKSPLAGPNFKQLYMYIGVLANIKKSANAKFSSRIFEALFKIRLLQVQINSKLTDFCRKIHCLSSGERRYH